MVIVSEISVSGSETYLVVMCITGIDREIDSYRIYKVIALFDFFTYSDKSHIA